MEVPEAHKLSDEERSVIALLRSFIAYRDDQQKHRLKTEFYDCLAPKFYDRLYKAASKLYRGIPDWEARMEEVFNDTFMAAFEDLETFEIGDNWDDAECEKVILNWLSVIGNNKFLKLASERKKERKALSGYRDELLRENKPGLTFERKAYKPTYDKAKFDAFWNKLNAMSKEILIACLEYGTLKEEVGYHISGKEIELLKLKDDLGSCAVPKQVKKLMAQSEHKERNTDHLPDEVLEKLKTKYGVTSAAIRKAKQRALEGLRNCKI
jgi:DNA-directed RNA polymerase specialized sigma24 family protein